MIKIELSKNSGLIANTALFVSRVAEQCGVEEKRARMLCFALETALELRMQNLSDDNPTLLVEVRPSDSELSVSITDKGVPYILTKNQKHVLKSGLVDRFKFEQLSAQGQRLSFFCALSHAGAEDAPSWEGETRLLDKDVRCELTKARDEDVIEAIRCLWAVYRYEYLHSQLYHLDYFKEKLRSGEYISILARNGHKQTLGHVGLESLESFPGMMEVCSLITVPLARGCGVAGKLVAAAAEAGDRMALGGLFSRPVVFHGASQKLFNAQQFTPCGMCFNLLESSIIKDKNFSIKSPRQHVAYCVRIHDKTTEHRLYLPEESKAFVQDVLDKVGMNYVLPVRGAPCDGASAVSYELSAENKTLEVKIDRIGPDFESRMKDLQDAGAVDMILVYLNMNDPSCPDVYRRFREQGYVFSGCFPGSSSGDYLILQDLKGIPFLREEIAAEPAYREMLDRLYEIMDR